MSQFYKKERLSKTAKWRRSQIMKKRKREEDDDLVDYSAALPHCSKPNLISVGAQNDDAEAPTTNGNQYSSDESSSYDEQLLSGSTDYSIDSDVSEDNMLNASNYNLTNEVDNSPKHEMSTFLQKWAAKSNIKLNDLDTLLKGLKTRTGLSTLPSCRRSLLHSLTTPRSRNIAMLSVAGKCPCRKKKHYCSFDGDSVTLQSIGKSLCHISRSLYLLGSKFNYLREEMNELKKIVGAGNNHGEGLETTDIDNILTTFPITSLEKVMEVEKKLAEDKEFFKSCVAYFASSAVKGSENRTVISILYNMISLDVALNFTFTGINRKDHKQTKTAFKDLILSRVLLNAFQRCWPRADMRKACAKASIWLAQANYKLTERIKKDGVEENRTPLP